MRKGVMKIYAAERWLYLHHFHILPKVLKIFIRVVLVRQFRTHVKSGGVTLSSRRFGCNIT